MLKANRKTLIIASIVTVLPALIGILCWDRLPDVMATHFGINNEADGFSSKAFAVSPATIALPADSTLSQTVSVTCCTMKKI